MVFKRFYGVKEFGVFKSRKRVWLERCKGEKGRVSFFRVWSLDFILSVRGSRGSCKFKRYIVGVYF